jgi:hypothetical protein
MNTPKEKAKELYDKYIVYASDATIESRERTAKECALFCAQQVLDSNTWFRRHWLAVKDELNKI